MGKVTRRFFPEETRCPKQPAATSGTLSTALQPNFGTACTSVRLVDSKLIDSQSHWQKTQNLANDREALSNIRRGFQALTAILNDESRSPAPHLCLQFAAAQQIYTGISKIAATSFDEGIVRDAVAFYNALIDSEEEDFLENDVFAVSLMNFINRTVGSGTMAVGEDIEADIVELLFGIAAKIRLQPEILPVWFTTATDSDSRPRARSENFAGVTQKEDFPLCYQLIDHVHHEGRIGDFARTGLLYVFESASKSMTLEQWIVNSDLPTLMASGLGALYSQLSRCVPSLLLNIFQPSNQGQKAFHPASTRQSSARSVLLRLCGD